MKSVAKAEGVRSSLLGPGCAKGALVREGRVESLCKWSVRWYKFAAALRGNAPGNSPLCIAAPSTWGSINGLDMVR